MSVEDAADHSLSGEPAVGRKSESERAFELGARLMFHGGEWTEEDYESLPEEVPAELHDGHLILPPGPEVEHQFARHELTTCFVRLVGNARKVAFGVDLRMADGRRYRTPDLVIVRERQEHRPLLPENLRLVGEIVSPEGGDEYTSRWEAYRDAGLEWYLILNPAGDGGYRAELYHLEGGEYVLATKADAGQTLRLPPFDGDIDLAQLRLSGPETSE